MNVYFILAIIFSILALILWVMSVAKEEFIIASTVYLTLCVICVFLICVFAWLGGQERAKISQAKFYNQLPLQWKKLYDQKITIPKETQDYFVEISIAENHDYFPKCDINLLSNVFQMDKDYFIDYKELPNVPKFQK